MERGEVTTPKIELQNTEAGPEIRTTHYSLLFHEDSPYIDLRSSDGELWMELQKASRIETSENEDVTYGFGRISHEQHPDGSLVVTVPSQTESGAFKEQVWVCRDDFIETYVTIETSGDLKEVQLFGGTVVAPNLFGESMSQQYAERIYNPQPSEREQTLMPATESTHIATSGMWAPGRRREFLVTPFTYGFHKGHKWLMASVSAPIEDQDAVDFHVDTHEDGFSLKLAYDRTPVEGGSFTTPSLLLHFAPEPAVGLQDMQEHAESLGHLPPSQPPARIGWHTDAKFVSWGHQQERGHYDNERAKSLATESFITKSLDILESHDINVGTVVIDDKWQQEYGTNTPDLEKWPDLAKFTAAQHELGRHVLLWVKLFDPEGLPPELCIVDKNGRPIASDPTNPDYIKLVRQQVHDLLSPDRYDADGLKLDFLAQLPHGPGLRWHGTKRGHAALHHLMSTIYDAAKTAKPDALIEAQVVSPWFADTFDQVRLNDTNERHQVTWTMGERARLAETLLPDHSLDPDGWPLTDLKMWRRYIEVQPDLMGTVTTHYVETVGGEPLTPGDYLMLARAIRRVTPRTSPR